MPNKKPKVSTSKGKIPTTPELTQAASSSSGPVEPPTSTSASHAQPNLPPPNFSDDFWTKNARAKALIMSTLVPGSEAWKIAEPIELASNIMSALEQKYSPKDAKGKPLRGKDLETWDRANKNKKEVAEIDDDPLRRDVYKDPTSTEFIGDFVAGRPMDKYLNLYKDKLAVAQLAKSSSSNHERTHPLVPTEEIRQGLIASTLANMAKQSKLEASRLPDLPARQLTSHPDAEPDLPIPETFDLSSPPSPIHLPTITASLRWKHQPVRHDCYLTEYQANIFFNDDLDRKRQIQVATTKVLMQKLPTRELRLLWAVLYGGEGAPWPGSCSPVIPGVTSMQWGNHTYELDYRTCVASWNSKVEGKG